MKRMATAGTGLLSIALVGFATFGACATAQAKDYAVDPSAAVAWLKANGQAMQDKLQSCANNPDNAACKLVSQSYQAIQRASASEASKQIQSDLQGLVNR